MGQIAPRLKVKGPHEVKPVVEIAVISGSFHVKAGQAFNPSSQNLLIF